MTMPKIPACETKILRLEQLVEFARQHSRYYANHYKKVAESGWKIQDLPLIEPRTYWQGSDVISNWSVLTRPFSEGIVFKTGGTTGGGKLSLYTRNEWHTFVKSFSRSLENQLQPGDKIANLFFAGDLYSSFLFIHGALAQVKMGVCEYPLSGAMEIPALFEQLNLHQINVLVGVPAMLLQFAAKIVAEAQSLPAIRMILFGCESLFEEQRLLLNQAFPNAQIASIGCASVDAGLIGSSDESCLGGEHRAFSPETIVEIIDEENGEVIVEENRSGMLVVTNLTRQLMPIIRYPVGDRAAWCEPAGNPARKFVLQGRSSLGHRIRVGSISIFPDELDKLISLELGRKQWQLVLSHHNHCDKLRLRIAYTGNSNLGASLSHQVANSDPSLLKLIKAGQLQLLVEWCRQDELICNTRTGKLQRVVDKRSYLVDEKRL